MTPTFSQAVDPIFIYVFSTLRRISEDGQAVQISAVRRELEALFRQADAQVGDDAAWKSGKYAITAWIDEMLGVVCEDWVGNEEWKRQPLEQTLFGMARAFDEFYKRSKSAAEMAAGDDAVESYFAAVLLGYRGLYGHDDMARLAADQQMPSDPQGWVALFSDYIQKSRERRASAAQPEQDRTIRTATPFWSRSMMVWPWVLATILIGFNMLYYFWV